MAVWNERLREDQLFFHSGETMQGGMKNLMRQARQMQDKIQKAQDEVEGEEFEASTGGGAVTAVVTGAMELVSIDIDEAAVDPDDVEMLEEMIVGAVNQALQEAEETKNEKMEEVTGGMDMPGMF
jgi:DNA-binding YbaB/EbfC family protein